LELRDTIYHFPKWAVASTASFGFMRMMQGLEEVHFTVRFLRCLTRAKVYWKKISEWLARHEGKKAEGKEGG